MPNTIPYQSTNAIRRVKPHLADHPVANAIICVAVSLSAGFGARAYWLWHYGESYLSPNDPGIGPLVAMVESLGLSWLTAIAAAGIAFANRKNLVVPVRWLAFLPIAVLLLDRLAAVAIDWLQ